MQVSHPYNIILASTSTLYGDTYLNYLQTPLRALFKDVKSIVFIPYARPGGISLDDYTSKAASFFQSMDITVKGLHTFQNPIEGIQQAEGFFTGGGNTFLLLKTLYENNLLQAIKEKVQSGTPYLGASAGSNIGGKTINTTNDMPIVYPPSFEAMGLVPFNLNPHYLDPQPDLKHNGETRETRILEFNGVSDIPVVGLREGSWLRVIGNEVKLEGTLSARIIEQGKTPYELASGSLIKF